MINYLKIALFLFAIIPFSIIYFSWLFGFDETAKYMSERVFWFIICMGLAYKVITRFIDWCMQRGEDKPSPLSENMPNLQQNTLLDQKSSDIQSGSSGSFDMSKYKPGSQEAANAYKQSSEHLETVQAIREIDDILADAIKLKQGVEA